MKIEDVWEAYQRRIRAFLNRKVANPADVDELLQDISINVFKGLPALDDPASLQPWLFQTAHRTIIDFYRRSATARDVSAAELWHVKDDPEALHELERCVEPFINALPAEKAELLRDIDIEGMSQTDYAERHGFTYSTLKSRVGAARADLRTLFEACCDLSLDGRGNISDYTSKSGCCD
ncbi:sigma-70 family RNA polymerase sigma factor [Tropicimonas sp. TH_r6]|uniref:sigma-70 family RNA polymerase sigma factor n=1 Tax=Tropicimonas sp. TH_r6 TaxID=3082085 RepID=UPI00295595A2|nr:sigma-70 family RNA polymerase sigma factor [Tropicimonas sp. TH_r6]MDV7141591.1 sigma-70 family RNA polymerase sigma factor [Tropicimonas sp. TH_r6]